MKKLNKTILLVGILVYGLFSFLAGQKKLQSHPETEKEYLYLSLFSEVISLVKTNYVEDVAPPEKFPGAFSAMLSSLDPFSAYLDAAKTGTYRAYLKGQFHCGGIFGAKVRNYFHVTDILPGSPAEKAGIKMGDRIKAVNGESFYSRSFWEMYLALLSTEPRDLQVVLFKKKSRDTKKINIRTELLEPCAAVKPLQKDLLLVKLSRIDAAAAALLKEKLTAYHKNKPLKLIIDLRTYCGGDFESFTKITNLFFKDTLLLTLKYKNREEDFLLGSKDALEYKAVVIINRSTRMYGELLAAMFKDSGPPSNRPAALVGTSTQGFISRLRPIPLQDGSSILLTEGLFLLNDKLTTSGVDPDIVVKDKESAKILDKCISILNPDPAGPGSSKREKSENDKKKRKTR